MRGLVLMMTVLAALVLNGSRAEAGYDWHPWCAWLATGVEAGSCAYDSLSACWTTVRGVGGYCGINPYPPPAAAQRYYRKRNRYYR